MLWCVGAQLLDSTTAMNLASLAKVNRQALLAPLVGAQAIERSCRLVQDTAEKQHPGMPSSTDCYCMTALLSTLHEEVFDTHRDAGSPV